MRAGGMALWAVLAIVGVASAESDVGRPAAKKAKCPALAVFRCSMKADDGNAFQDCFRFGNQAQVSSKFEFFSDRLQSTVGCACNPTAGKKTKFDAGPTFTCTSDLGVAFQARVKGTKLLAGTVTSAAGGTVAFTCTNDAACAL